MEHSLSILPSFRQTLTVYLYELKKGLKTLVTKFLIIYQCSKEKPPLFTTSDVGLACVQWSMSEPFQKRLRQIGVSCWDPCRLWVHLKELISDCFCLNVSCYWFCFRMIRICSVLHFCYLWADSIAWGCCNADFLSGSWSRALSCLSQDVGYPVWQEQKGFQRQEEVVWDGER